MIGEFGGILGFQSITPSARVSKRGHGEPSEIRPQMTWCLICASEGKRAAADPRPDEGPLPLCLVCRLQNLWDVKRNVSRMCRC